MGDSIKQPHNWKAYMHCKPSTFGCSDVIRYDGQGNIIGIVTVGNSVKLANKQIVSQQKRKAKAEYLSKKLQDKATSTELFLYCKLKPILKNQGIKIMFQHPIQYDKSFYILDIYITKAKLCIEVDGNHHKFNTIQRKRDEYRDKILQTIGIETIRFSNDDIKTDYKSIINTILTTVGIRLGVNSRANKGAEAISNVLQR
jgi:very-short-patch-repair endonuclease